MNVAIVGTGRMATQRARALKSIESVSVTAVASRAESRAADFIAENKLKNAESRSFETILEDTHIGAVIITGPNSAHLGHALKALTSDKHVFLEYPPAATEVDLAALERCFAGTDRSLHLGLTHRYDGEFNALRAEFGSDGRFKLGSPVSMQKIVCSGNPISRWYDDDQVSGGMFVASMYHHIDESIALFGRVGDSWSTYQATRTVDGKILSDSASVSLVHEGGCVSNIAYARGMSKPGIGSTTTIIATDGYFVHDSHGARVLNASGEVRFESMTDSVPVDSMLEDTRAFVDLVQSGEKSDGTFESGCETLRICLSLQKSAE